MVVRQLVFVECALQLTEHLSLGLEFASLGEDWWQSLGELLHASGKAPCEIAPPGCHEALRNRRHAIGQGVRIHCGPGIEHLGAALEQEIWQRILTTPK